MLTNMRPHITNLDKAMDSSNFGYNVIIMWQFELKMEQEEEK